MAEITNHISGSIEKIETTDDVKHPLNATYLNGIESSGFLPIIISTTYANLKSLRDAGTLTPGATYRITDYTCTTTQSETQSAGHQFDILVTADNTNALNENAHAIVHEGDTYFANSKLSVWELKYSLDNDTARFAWADSSNGKGVIYYMKDEFNNECSYDFKNIQFKRYATKVSDTDKFSESVFELYSYWATASYLPNGLAYDTTVSPNAIFVYTFHDAITNTDGSLNNTTFGTLTSGYDTCLVYNNSIDTYLVFMSVDEGEGNKVIQLNDIVIYYRIVDDENPIGSYDNKFGSNCHTMTVSKNCYAMTFGNSCYYNSFGNYCYSNSFGNACYSNSFGNYCHYNYLCSSKISSTYLNYAKYNAFENGVSYVSLYCRTTKGSLSAYLQNVHIHEGVLGTSSSRKTISVSRNLAYGTDVYAEGHVTMTA